MRRGVVGVQRGGAQGRGFGQRDDVLTAMIEEHVALVEPDLRQPRVRRREPGIERDGALEGLAGGTRLARTCSAACPAGSIAIATARLISSCTANISPMSRSYRSAQMCPPLSASINWALTRMREPPRRTLPSSR